MEIDARIRYESPGVGVRFESIAPGHPDRLESWVSTLTPPSPPAHSPDPRQRSPLRPAGVRIAGTGLAAPKHVVTSAELAQRHGQDEAWIVQRTGIRERRIADDGTTVIDLAREAVAQALDRASIPASRLDLLLCATLTGEMVCPSTAARVVHELGAGRAGAMDVNAACSGFVYGLNLGSGLIEAGRARTVAVVGADLLSRITDWNEPRTSSLFGDGAGAAVLVAGDDPEQGCLYQSMNSNGSLWRELYLPTHASQVPEGAVFSGALHKLQMNGREVYKFAVSTLLETVDVALAATGLTLDDIAMIVAHQSNARILESVREKLGLPTEKVYVNIDRFGNTSAASVAICLHELFEARRIGRGDRVMMLAVGGGMTWASSVWRL